MESHVFWWSRSRFFSMMKSESVFQYDEVGSRKYSFDSTTLTKTASFFGQDKDSESGSTRPSYSLRVSCLPTITPPSYHRRVRGSPSPPLPRRLQLCPPARGRAAADGGRRDGVAARGRRGLVEGAAQWQGMAGGRRSSRAR